jgi:hypothetical protein
MIIQYRHTYLRPTLYFQEIHYFPSLIQIQYPSHLPYPLPPTSIPSPYAHIKPQGLSQKPLPRLHLTHMLIPKLKVPKRRRNNTRQLHPRNILSDTAPRPGGEGDEAFLLLLGDGVPSTFERWRLVMY